jgi:hypothetical protein
MVREVKEFQPQPARIGRERREVGVGLREEWIGGAESQSWCPCEPAALGGGVLLCGAAHGAWPKPFGAVTEPRREAEGESAWAGSGRSRAGGGAAVRVGRAPPGIPSLPALACCTATGGLPHFAPRQAGRRWNGRMRCVGKCGCPPVPCTPLDKIWLCPSRAFALPRAALRMPWWCLFKFTPTHLSTSGCSGKR